MTFLDVGAKGAVAHDLNEQLDHEGKAEPRLCDRQPDGAFTIQLIRFQGAWFGGGGRGVAIMSENENHISAIVSVGI